MTTEFKKYLIDSYADAFDRYQEVKAKKNITLTWFEYIGHTPGVKVDWSDGAVYLSEDSIRKIEMLLGLHYQTIILAQQVKQRSKKQPEFLDVYHRMKLK